MRARKSHVARSAGRLQRQRWRSEGVVGMVGWGMVGWALLSCLLRLCRAYQLIETNYGRECTRLSYTCPEFEACCTNRTKYSQRTRYNCLEAMDGRLMIYECVGAIRRRPSVPASLQAACQVFLFFQSQPKSFRRRRRSGYSTRCDPEAESTNCSRTPETPS